MLHNNAIYIVFIFLVFIGKEVVVCCWFSKTKFYLKKGGGHVLKILNLLVDQINYTENISFIEIAFVLTGKTIHNSQF